jgi:hypothetical protein
MMADEKAPNVSIIEKGHPTPLPLYEPPVTPARSRMPRLAVLIPWILATLFFLTTLWYTSIALFVNTRHPITTNDYTPEINVYIDGIEATPSVKISTAPAATITSAPTSSQVNDNQGGEFITKRAAEPEPHNAANQLAPPAPQTTLVLEVKRNAVPAGAPLEKKAAEPARTAAVKCSLWFWQLPGTRCPARKRAVAEALALEKKAASPVRKPAVKCGLWFWQLPGTRCPARKREADANAIKDVVLKRDADADAEAEASKHNHCGLRFFCRKRVLEERTANAEPEPEPEVVEEKRGAEADASKYNHCGGRFYCKKRAEQKKRVA